MKLIKSVLREIIKELQAISGGKVHPFITAKNLTLKGKKYPEIEFEVVRIDNTKQIVKLRVLSPKNLFGEEINVDFRTLRRGAFFKTDTSNKMNISESTFVFHYGQGRDKFAHELKSFNLKSALKTFIDMYKIPKSEWDKIVVKKSRMF
jgi:hypothetical protein